MGGSSERRAGEAFGLTDYARFSDRPGCVEPATDAHGVRRHRFPFEPALLARALARHDPAQAVARALGGPADGLWLPVRDVAGVDLVLLPGPGARGVAFAVVVSTSGSRRAAHARLRAAGRADDVLRSAPLGVDRLMPALVGPWSVPEVERHARACVTLGVRGDERFLLVGGRGAGRRWLPPAHAEEAPLRRGLEALGLAPRAGALSIRRGRVAITVSDADRHVTVRLRGPARRLEAARALSPPAGYERHQDDGDVVFWQRVAGSDPTGERACAIAASLLQASSPPSGAPRPASSR